MKTKLPKPSRSVVRLARKAAAPGRRTSPAVKAVSALEMKSILVPIDFSDLSKKALDYAVPFARQFRAKLTLLYVVEPVAAVAFPGLAPLVMENDRVVAACKSELAQLLKQRGIAAKHVEKILVRVGRSFAEITDAARSLKTDLIILSTHGASGLKQAWLGSTAERVVRHAPCPVLVVREHEHEFV